MTKASSNLPFPKAILQAVAEFLGPLDTARASRTSKEVNEILKLDQTWAIIARNLKLPLQKDKPYKAQVIEYYQKANEVMNEFIKSQHLRYPKPGMLVPSDPVMLHEMLQDFLLEARYFSGLIKELILKMEKDPKNTTLAVLYDKLLDKWALDDNVVADAIDGNLCVEGNPENIDDVKLDLTVLDLLIKKGAKDNNTIDVFMEGEGINHPRIRTFEQKLTEFLISKNFKVTPTAVYKAVKNSRTDHVELFLKSDVVKLTEIELEDCIAKAKELKNQPLVELLESYKS